MRQGIEARQDKERQGIGMRSEVRGKDTAARSSIDHSLLTRVFFLKIGISYLFQSLSLFFITKNRKTLKKTLRTCSKISDTFLDIRKMA